MSRLHKCVIVTGVCIDCMLNPSCDSHHDHAGKARVSPSLTDASKPGAMCNILLLSLYGSL